MAARKRGRLRGTGLKQLERWSHWQAMRGGQNQRVPASSWWRESSGARAQWQQNAISAAQTENDSPTWTCGPSFRDGSPGTWRCRANQQTHSIPWAALAAGWLAHRPGGLWQTLDAGQSWSVFGIDALALLGASDAWIDPNNWTMFGWPRGTASERRHLQHRHLKRGTVEQLGRRCRLGLRRRTNNAFMSSRAHPPKTDTSGWGRFGAVRHRGRWGRLCCKALVLR